MGQFDLSDFIVIAPILCEGVVWEGWVEGGEGAVRVCVRVWMCCINNLVINLKMMVCPDVST